MSLLIFSYRRQQIISQKSALNMKLLELNKKLMDLQSYAASIADGTVSLNDLMNAPASMFGRMSIFMMYSHQQSMMGAQEKFAYMSQVPGAMPQMPDPKAQQQYAQMMFKNLYDQEREKAGKVEEKLLNKQDQQLQSEKAKIEDQLRLLDGEEKTISEQEGKAAEQAAPKYVA